MRVRLVTVDPVPPLPPDWRRTVESYSGLAGLFDRVEVAFGRESPRIEVSRGGPLRRQHLVDRPPGARTRSTALERERFLYLIQEYEPFTFPMGSLRRARRPSRTRFPHHALFSTELLARLLPRRRLGVYAEGGEAGDAGSAAFQNAITAIEPPPAAELAAARPRGGCSSTRGPRRTRRATCSSSARWR